MPTTYIESIGCIGLRVMAREDRTTGVQGRGARAKGFPRNLRDPVTSVDELAVGEPRNNPMARRCCLPAAGTETGSSDGTDRMRQTKRSGEMGSRSAQ